MKTHFKEGDINEELIDKMVQLSGKYYSFGKLYYSFRLTLQYSRWAFSGLLTDGVTKKALLSTIFHTSLAMIKLGTVVS